MPSLSGSTVNWTTLWSTGVILGGLQIATVHQDDAHIATDADVGIPRGIQVTTASQDYDDDGYSTLDSGMPSLGFHTVIQLNSVLSWRNAYQLVACSADTTGAGGERARQPIVHGGERVNLSFICFVPSGCLGGEREGSESRLKFKFNATDDWEGAVFTCFGVDGLNQTDSKDLIIRMADPPELSISPASPGVYVNNFVVLMCAVRGWQVIGGQLQWTYTGDASAPPTYEVQGGGGDGGGSLDQPTLSLRLTVKGGHWKGARSSFECQFESGGTWLNDVVSSAAVTVLVYDLPRLSILPSGDSPILEGENVVLTCVVDGVALGGVRWTVSGCESCTYDQTEELRSFARNPNLTLRFAATADWHQAEVVCELTESPDRNVAREIRFEQIVTFDYLSWVVMPVSASLAGISSLVVVALCIRAWSRRSKATATIKKPHANSAGRARVRQSPSAQRPNKKSQHEQVGASHARRPPAGKPQAAVNAKEVGKTDAPEGRAGGAGAASVPLVEEPFDDHRKEPSKKLPDTTTATRYPPDDAAEAVEGKLLRRDKTPPPQQKARKSDGPAAAAAAVIEQVAVAGKNSTPRQKKPAFSVSDIEAAGSTDTASATSASGAETDGAASAKAVAAPPDAESQHDTNLSTTQAASQDGGGGVKSGTRKATGAVARQPSGAAKVLANGTAAGSAWV